MVRFGKSENDIKFDHAIDQLLNKPKETMVIVEFVLERERRLGEKRGLAKGEKKGIEKGKRLFVNTMLSQTDFDDPKIASLADVTIETVQKLRNQKK
ncbi:hypothetical protein [Runella limosa]|uniref:hypothetical protein n=1 Tax=Runella limosa TaxID=370978 RepID=UPI0004048E56|nr:hypothetical protein [Runella limosa]